MILISHGNLTDECGGVYRRGSETFSHGCFCRWQGNPEWITDHRLNFAPDQPQIMDKSALGYSLVQPMFYIHNALFIFCKISFAVGQIFPQINPPTFW
ncbi:MAG: hypothetical protein WCO45_18865, partial [Pseudanabaena sp. ELA607]